MMGIVRFAAMTGIRHRIGSCTVTSFVPSGNVASTCTSWIISATPSMTCARVMHLAARLHQVGDAAAVARALDDEVGDQRHRFGMVQLHAALQPPARDHRGHADQQLVLLPRRQVHAGSLSAQPYARQRRVRRAAPSARRSQPRAARHRQRRGCARPACRPRRWRRICGDAARTASSALSASGATCTIVAIARAPSAMAGRCNMAVDRAFQPDRIMQQQPAAAPHLDDDRAASPCSTRSPIAARPNTSFPRRGTTHPRQARSPAADPARSDRTGWSPAAATLPPRRRPRQSACARCDGALPGKAR